MKNKLRSLLSSFKYAFRGVRFCVLRERNFRIHLVFAMWVLVLARRLELGGVSLAVLLLTIANVIAMEMLNTAIEATVDLASPEIHPLAEIAKDVSAGAVLLSAVVSVAVGLWLLWQPDRLVPLALELVSSPPLFLAVCGGFLLSVMFVFCVKGEPAFPKK